MARRATTNSKADAETAAPPERNAPVSNPPPWIPVEETNLTREERRMLPDPTRFTQDDADAMTIIRNEMRGARYLSLDEAREVVFGKRRRR